MEKANKDQYALLFGWIYPQILIKLGYEVNPKNITQIHEEFKAHLGYETISGVSQGLLQKFTMDVKGEIAVEKGIYISDPGEPDNAENLPLEILWKK